MGRRASGFPGGRVVKNLPANAWDTDSTLGQEDPLEKKTTTHSSILAWNISWTGEPAGLQSLGSQRVKHDWARMYTEEYNGRNQITKHNSHTNVELEVLDEEKVRSRRLEEDSREM